MQCAVARTKIPVALRFCNTEGIDQGSEAGVGGLKHKGGPVRGLGAMALALTMTRGSPIMASFSVLPLTSRR
jgi:hypothetical protein